jgi:tight adherence protein B
VTETSIIGWIAGVFVAVGGAATVAIVIGDAASAPQQLWLRYEQRLDETLRALFIASNGRKIARMQLVLIATTAALSMVFGNPFFLLGSLIVAVGPAAWLGSRRRKRTTELEQQIESWLQLLASALRANPSVGSAIASSATLTSSPLKEEVELVVKKQQLGAPLERALLEMGVRSESQTVSSALSTLIISQRTGGDVPKLLDEASSSLREMARLEGFVRSKTAESKFQAMALAVGPFAFVAGVRWIKPDWFDPLLDGSFIGYAVIGGALALWALAIFITIRILKVED